MKDPSFDIRTAYADLLSELTYNEVAVPVYDEIAPKGRPANYILLREQTNTETGDNTDYGTDSTILLEIVSENSVSKKGVDDISELVLEILKPGFEIAISEDFKSIYTVLEQSNTFSVNDNAGRVQIIKQLRIRHELSQEVNDYDPLSNFTSEDIIAHFGQEAVNGWADPATYRNSDSTYTEEIPSGGEHVAPDIEFTDSDGTVSFVPANTNIIASAPSYSVEAANIHNRILANGDTPLTGLQKTAIANWADFMKSQGQLQYIREFWHYRGFSTVANGLVGWIGKVATIQGGYTFENTTGVDFDGATGYINDQYNAFQEGDGRLINGVGLGTVRTSFGGYTLFGVFNGTSTATRISRTQSADDSVIYGTAENTNTVESNSDIEANSRYYVRRNAVTGDAEVLKNGVVVASELLSDNIERGHANYNYVTGALNTANPPNNFSKNGVQFRWRLIADSQLDVAIFEAAQAQLELDLNL